MDFWYRLPLRTRLGFVAAFLLIVAGISLALWSQDSVHHKPLGAVIKLAPIIFLLWLAWKDLQRIPLWAYLAAPPILILCALKPMLWFVVIPVALVALFVMPKGKKGGRDR